jgi:hypothetical protein
MMIARLLIFASSSSGSEATVLVLSTAIEAAVRPLLVFEIDR